MMPGTKYRLLPSLHLPGHAISQPLNSTAIQETSVVENFHGSYQFGLLALMNLMIPSFLFGRPKI